MATARLDQTSPLDTFRAMAKRAGKKVQDVIREAVLKECKRRGWSAYDLAKEMESHGVGRSISYEFFAGKKSIRSNTASVFLSALGIRLVPSNSNAATA